MIESGASRNAMLVKAVTPMIIVSAKDRVLVLISINDLIFLLQ
jgi:hypothetical protein